MNIKTELEIGLNELAAKYWEKRGAKFGELQTVSDLDAKVFTDPVFIPTRLRDAKFITKEALITVGGWDGRTICCTLRVVPILKNGNPGQPVILKSEILFL